MTQVKLHPEVLYVTLNLFQGLEVFSFNPFSGYTKNMKCKKCGGKIKLVIG